MAGFGAVPKPNARRSHRNLAGGASLQIRLPVGGRHGETPAWPLGGRRARRELEIWERLWRTPQAVAWERLGWHDTVARYARLEMAAERRGAPGVVLTEVRQLEDRLGLSPMALLRLRWEIVDDDELATPVEEKTLDIRDRLRVSS